MNCNHYHNLDWRYYCKVIFNKQKALGKVEAINIITIYIQISQSEVAFLCVCVCVCHMVNLHQFTTMLVGVLLSSLVC